MSNSNHKKTIQEQVEELTEEQKDKIIKFGKIGLILMVIVVVPSIIITLLGLIVLINPPLGLDYNSYDMIYTGFLATLVIAGLLIIGVLVFVKIMCPGYSDAKYRYISKSRKNK